VNIREARYRFVRRIMAWYRSVGTCRDRVTPWRRDGRRRTAKMFQSVNRNGLIYMTMQNMHYDIGYFAQSEKTEQNILEKRMRRKRIYDEKKERLYIWILLSRDKISQSCDIICILFLDNTIFVVFTLADIFLKCSYALCVDIPFICVACEYKMLWKMIIRQTQRREIK